MVGVASLLPLFKSLPENLTRIEALWRNWVDSRDPELQPAVGKAVLCTPRRWLGTNQVDHTSLCPMCSSDLEALFKEDGEAGVFYKTILVRCLREDRIVPAVLELIRFCDSVQSTAGDDSGGLTMTLS